MKQKRLHLLVAAALLAAMIAVFTAFLKMPIGNRGYLHFGDALIYLAGCILPPPYCIGAAAVGGALADIMAGAAIWALPTALIKSANIVPFLFLMKFQRRKDEESKILTRKTTAASVFSGLITIGGYWLAETLLYNMAAATVAILFSVIQAVGSAVLFYAAAFALDRIQLKKLLGF